MNTHRAAALLNLARGRSPPEKRGVFIILGNDT
jgi:hypothetical protein